MSGNFGLKTFMNKLWNAKGFVITGQKTDGKWFTGTITGIRSTAGVDFSVTVVTDAGEEFVVSGLDIANSKRFLAVEGL